MLNRVLLILVTLLVASCIEAGQIPLASSSHSDGENLYKYYGCSACHGEAGDDSLPGIPRLAGQDELYLVNQLKDFKSGVRSNGMSQSMIGSLQDITEQEMQQVSKYLSLQ